MTRVTPLTTDERQLLADHWQLGWRALGTPDTLAGLRTSSSGSYGGGQLCYQVTPAGIRWGEIGQLTHLITWARLAAARLAADPALIARLDQLWADKAADGRANWDAMTAINRYWYRGATRAQRLALNAQQEAYFARCWARDNDAKGVLRALLLEPTDLLDWAVILCPTTTRS